MDSQAYSKGLVDAAVATGRVTLWDHAPAVVSVNQVPRASQVVHPSINLCMLPLPFHPLAPHMCIIYVEGPCRPLCAGGALCPLWVNA